MSGDGPVAGVFEPPDLGYRAIVPCDTTAAGQLNGCNSGVVLEAISGEVLEFNAGGTLERNVVVTGHEAISIVGMQKSSRAFDEVCVTVDIQTGPPPDRGKVFCVNIAPGEGTVSSCNRNLPVVSDPAFCGLVQSSVDRGYHVNGLAYVIDINLPRMGQAASTTIRTCAGFVAECAPDRVGVIVTGTRQAFGYHTPGSCCSGRLLVK
jgi:hypothetical protein